MQEKKQSPYAYQFLRFQSQDRLYQGSYLLLSRKTTMNLGNAFERCGRGGRRGRVNGRLQSELIRLPREQHKSL